MESEKQYVEEEHCVGCSLEHFEKHFSSHCTFDARATAEAVLEGALTLASIRRVAWQLLLGILSDESVSSPWVHTIFKNRRRYWSLVKKHESSNTTQLNPQISHPLSAPHSNPWCAEVNILSEIRKDVERTFPERCLFQRKETAAALEHMLLVWSKENPDPSYRQGLNELAAICYTACYRNQSQPGNSIASVDATCSQMETAYRNLLSPELEDIEADAYTIFNRLMQTGMKAMFVNPAPPSFLETPLLPALPVCHTKSPIVVRCEHLFENELPKSEPVLASHLEKEGVQPQLFLLRWIRLLFAREFHIDDTLTLWDAIFSHARLQGPVSESVPRQIKNTSDSRQVAMHSSKSLPLVDRIALAMLHYLSKQLLQLDNTGCNRRLLKFPPTESVMDLVSVSLGIHKPASPAKREPPMGEATEKYPPKVCSLKNRPDAPPREILGSDEAKRALQGASLDSRTAPRLGLATRLESSVEWMRQALLDVEACDCSSNPHLHEIPCPHYIAVAKAARNMLEPSQECVNVIRNSPPDHYDRNSVSRSDDGGSGGKSDSVPVVVLQSK